jgi:hypothetical protein
MEMSDVAPSQGVVGQMLAVVRTLIERHGGVAGIVKHL